MKLNAILLLFIFILGIQKSTYAETWNEPWQKDILKNADFFVLANVISNEEDVGTTIEILKHFGNQSLSGEVLINGFSLLDIRSSSGHGVHLNFEKGQTLYFLLTKGEDGNYTLPTPSSGFAGVDEEKNVYATYRHSYHQALVPQEVYEKTYSEIWNYYKTSNYDQVFVMDFIHENLAQPPAGFEPEDLNTFFMQHVALEMAFLLDISIDLQQLKAFVEYENFHANISALQLLGNSKDEDVKEYLFNYIKNEKNENFQKVIAIWSLRKIGDQKYINKLKAIKNKLSEDQTGFGGNIMDPRVGTYFPSPKRAVENLK